MAKQAIVIGLGQFGMAVARSLSEMGVEVLAVDERPELVRAASPFTTEAVVLDASDETALAQAMPARKDLCVCAIGNEAREASILCTALLRQMGARRIVARAGDPLHARILRVVGAHEVVNPEEAFGERFATRLVYDRVLEEFPLGGGNIVISEVAVPQSFIGKSLRDLELPRRFEVNLVAVQPGGKGQVELPTQSTRIGEGDVIIVASRKGAVAKMMEKL
jgi:trk system potassium uptake protein TrkA